MFENAIKIPSKINSKILLKVVPGHFATSHSHINYYMDMTRLKVGQREAKAVASTMANNYKYNTPIDAIVCMDGTYVIGAYLAEILTDAGVISMNSHQSIYVIEPEFDSCGQMFFRDNIQPMVRGKIFSCLLLLLLPERPLTNVWSVWNIMVESFRDCLRFLVQKMKFTDIRFVPSLLRMIFQITNHLLRKTALFVMQDRKSMPL